jgi:hypothetical protein
MHLNSSGIHKEIISTIIQGHDEIITSIVVDEESLTAIWDEIERLDLCNKSDGEKPDPEYLKFIRKCGRIPYVVKTEKTKSLFDALGMRTTRFCGIRRNVSREIGTPTWESFEKWKQTGNLPSPLRNGE